MTDKEIFETEIKCIKRRSSGQCNGGTDCGNCDLLMDEQDIISAYERAIDNVDLINRQQAEVERLKEDNFIKSQKRANIFEITNAFERGRTDGIKKFADRLKERYPIMEHYHPTTKLCVNYFIRDIDNLVKEMVGDDK